MTFELYALFNIYLWEMIFYRVFKLIYYCPEQTDHKILKFNATFMLYIIHYIAV